MVDIVWQILWELDWSCVNVYSDFVAMSFHSWYLNSTYQDYKAVHSRAPSSFLLNRTFRTSSTSHGSYPSYFLPLQDGFSGVSDRRRFSFESDTVATQFGDVRRETMVINRPSTTPKVLWNSFITANFCQKIFLL